MRIARESRGLRPPLDLAGAGARARRPARCSSAPTSGASGCYLAMVSRGYDGPMPELDDRAAPPAGVLGRRRSPCPPRPRCDRRSSAWMLATVTASRARGARIWRSPTPTATRRCSASTCTIARGRAGRAARPERRRQDHARAAPQRHPRAAAGRGRASAGSRWRRRTCRRSGGGSAIVFQDPDDQLFMPTVRDDVAFGPANLGLRGAELDAPGRRGARRGRHGGARRPAAAPPQLRPAPAGRGGDRAGDASPRSSCSTSRRRTSTRPPAASSPTSCRRSTSRCCMVTHDLPVRAASCARGR